MLTQPTRPRRYQLRLEMLEVPQQQQAATGWAGRAGPWPHPALEGEKT